MMSTFHLCSVRAGMMMEKKKKLAICHQTNSILANPLRRPLCTDSFCLPLERSTVEPNRRVISPAAISLFVASCRVAALTQIKHLVAKEAAISPLSTSIAAALSTSTPTNGGRAAVSHTNTIPLLCVGLMPFDLRRGNECF